MGNSCPKKQITGSDARKKAVKLIVVHIKKKVSKEFIGSDNVMLWIDEMNDLLTREEVSISDYIKMRKKLNEVIECTVDEEIRYKLRDSWCSFGKALDRKSKAN